MITEKITQANELGINPESISDNALLVVEQLQQAGYAAYLVGGCVRDLMLQKKPKDFDVSTSATPEQVKKTFSSNSRIIGRRFKIVHVRFGYEVIEVATFRADASDRDNVAAHEMSQGEQGQLTRDNVYGTLEEDVVRRDFTVNALYYDPVAGQVYDYVNGIDDIKKAYLRSIGDPVERFREDPVRMLRIIRFAAKLGFEMEPEALEMIEQEGKLLSHVSPARLFEEVLKLFHGGAAYDTYKALSKHGLFKYLFPFTEQSVVEGENGMPEYALKNTDLRIHAGKPVIPAFLFACMMWDPIRADAQILMSSGTPESQAWRIAMTDGLRDQNQYVAVPRRLAEIILDIWNIHFRLIKRNPRMVKACLGNRRFRAAYDFLLLRAKLHEVDQELADWWSEIQEVDADEREEMIAQVSEVYKSQRNDYPQEGEADGNSVNYNSHDHGNTFSAPHLGAGRTNGRANTRTNNRTNARASSGAGRRNNRADDGGRSRGRGAAGHKTPGRGAGQGRAHAGARSQFGGARNRNPASQNASGDRYANKPATGQPARRGGRSHLNRRRPSAMTEPKDNNYPDADFNSSPAYQADTVQKKVKVRRKRRIVSEDDVKPIDLNSEQTG